MADRHQWDVFLSHSHADRDAAAAIAQRLRDEAGLRPFLDRWHLVPGDAWQTDLAEALDQSATAAVCIGPTGVAPWHNVELQTALDRAVAGDAEFRVIPVLLPDVDETDVPRFLAQRTWVDFRTGLDDADALQRLAAAVRGEAIDGDGYELPDDPAPYRGLLRFDVGDADLFFGRARETRELLERVAARRVVAVEGASGSGKSSLVRAGLLPRLATGAVADSARWHHLICTPGSEPFRALARQLARLAPAANRLALIDDLTERLARDRNGLRVAIGDLVADDPRPALVVVDQFEELFTLCGSEDRERCVETATAYVEMLAAAADPDGGVRVLVTLRADFLGNALQLPGGAALLADPVLLGPLDDTALREVIAGPAKVVGALFEKGLVGAILRDVHDQQGALPLLQHALLELWNHRRGPWLTLDAYEAIGGVGGALAQRADATYAALTPAQQQLAQATLLRLVAHGEGVAYARRRVRRDELYPAGADPSDLDAVLHAMSAEQARLVVADAETVELTHEALLREWTTLRRWLDTDRDAQRVHRRLTLAATEWDGPLERDPGGLYRGAPLAQVEEWAATHADQLNAVEAAFLDASRQASAEELERERERSRRLRRRLYATLVFFGIALLGAAAALIAFTRASDATARAERNAARALAQQARALAPRQPALAVAVAAEALERRSTPEIADALQVASAAFALTTWRPTAVVPGGPTPGEPPLFSPDGQRIATVDDDTVTIWDTATGDELASLTLRSTVEDMAWSADGARLATFHSTRVTVWDASTGEALHEFANLGGLVMRFSPDGARVAVVSVLDDREVTVTDVASGDDLVTVVDQSGSVAALAWSTDGDDILTVSRVGSVKIWDADTGEPRGTVPGVGREIHAVDVEAADGRDVLTMFAFGRPVATRDLARDEWLDLDAMHGGNALDIAFAPRAARVATAGADGTVVLWDAGSGEEIAILGGHSAAVTAVAFAANGDLLATGSEDGEVRLWDAGTGAEVDLLSGRGALVAMSWSANGDRVAVTSERVACPRGATRDCPVERDVGLWAATDGGQPPVTIVGGGAVRRLSVARDGRRIAALSDVESATGLAGSVTVFDAGSGAMLRTIALAQPPSDVAFAPDGDRLAVAASELTVGSRAAIWSAATGGHLVELINGTTSSDIAAVAWAPDGDRVAIARNDAATAETGGVGLGHGEVTVRDAASGAELLTRTEESWINDVAWSPDGSAIAAASVEDAKVWQAATGEERATLFGHGDQVRSVTFGPDGELIATASVDGTARIWDAATGDELRTLDGPMDWVTDVAFTPDGRHLVTVNAEVTGGRDPTDVDSSLTFWDVRTGEQLITVDGHSGRINDVEFAPDGRMVTAGEDRTIVVRRPVPTPGDACAVVGNAVTRAELAEALAGDRIVACTSLR